MILSLLLTSVTTSAQVHHGGGGYVFHYQMDYQQARKHLLSAAAQSWKNCYGTSVKFESISDLYVQMSLQKSLEAKDNCVEVRSEKYQCFVSHELMWSFGQYTRAPIAQPALTLEVGSQLEAQKIMNFFKQYRYKSYRD